MIYIDTMIHLSGASNRPFLQGGTMKHPNYYRHGGVEKHHDGSFTIYGTIENPEPTLFKQRYYDYTIESALKNFDVQIKQESEKYFVGE